jgi:hypothetical protein
MIKLELEMTYCLTVKGPLGATEGSFVGPREYWEMTSGRLTGKRINASIAMPGGDWMIVSSDRFGRPDVRMQLVTDDGELILLQYSGLVERTELFQKAAEGAGGTNWRDQYMRMAMRFKTGAKNIAGSTSISLSRKDVSRARKKLNTESIGILKGSGIARAWRATLAPLVRPILKPQGFDGCRKRGCIVPCHVQALYCS